MYRDIAISETGKLEPAPVFTLRYVTLPYV